MYNHNRVAKVAFGTHIISMITGEKAMSEKIHLFVPGRLCLFGEHSDWAGLNRMINADIAVGEAIVTGTEEGIYATAERADRFIVTSDLPLYHGHALDCEMNTAKLLEVAKDGGFFSYVAGVASYVNDNYSVGGVKIVVTDMTLPIKSGLSSSAAICVLVARAFNRLYKLKMNVKGEMQVAFKGEQRTPSRCGRLDQACAYGVKPVYMEFDGSEVDSKPLSIGKTMYWLITDLHAGKDTVKILADLNKCYPFAENDLERNVQSALGVENQAIIAKAVDHLQSGDAKSLGALMDEAQALFDAKVAPACPEELTAPVLHSLLRDPEIRQWVYGAKGVGSQGDGTAQFLCRSAEDRKALAEYLQKKRGMTSFALTLHPGQTVRRAIIPVAGFGTRLYPASKAIKKAFMPLVDKDGLLKPALLILMEQLEEAGIEEVCLVVGPGEKEIYDDFFAPLDPENYNKLPDEKQALQKELARMRARITYVEQTQRLGFGHAVYQCRQFTQDEPVLLLLGDTVYESYEDRNCMQQVIDAYKETGQTLVSLAEVPLSDVEHYGILHGQWEDDDARMLTVDVMVEKPTCDMAEEYLGVDNVRGEKKYYAVFGQYVLTPAVFAALGVNIEKGRMSGGEIQLTDALEDVRKSSGLTGFRPNGRAFDIGLPEAYRKTMAAYGRRS